MIRNNHLIQGGYFRTIPYFQSQTRNLKPYAASGNDCTYFSCCNKSFDFVSYLADTQKEGHAAQAGFTLIRIKQNILLITFSHSAGGRLTWD